MQKKMRPSLILDRLHKGFVCACLGLTVYGGYLLSLRAYRYFAYIKPMREQQKLKSQEELLAEGSSDKIVDSAPEIKL
ncbi:uncharacterized protein LOC123305954 [Chrysoperla carnea]|uniref:uncharacterized protein LOC123305954 n=1 Tax=Chrysoperla carnea TaxID=189513 RepID=UPI001D060680|nr:uncharacterized protein LOC123305954 [Chrysoperla carnea]